MFGKNLLSLETWKNFLEDARSFPTQWYISFGVIICTLFGMWIVPKLWRRQQFANLRRKKREACKEAIKLLEKRLETEGQLTAERVDEITGLPLMELVDKLQRGNLSAIHVLEAYQRKALDVHKKTNCLVEPILEAEEWAGQADMVVGAKPLLHGVPISIKDLFGIEGYDSTVGLARFIGQPMRDCIVTKVLKAHGAIPFVKTNVPQTMISWENTNPIFGQTLNPRDLTRGPGGSSGGEGALVAGGGSILGIGSDVGGSIRIPAACCGVYGMKLTAGRTSLRGMQYASEGQLCVTVSNGPLARDVDSLLLCSKVLLSPMMFELDTYTPPVLFREKMFGEKKGKALKIGYYVDDGLHTPVPPNARAVREAAEALRNQGHDVEEWNFSAARFMEWWPRIVFADNGEGLRKTLEDDKIDDAMKGLMTMLSMPRFLKKIIAILVKPFFPNLSMLMREMQGVDSVLEWWKTVEQVKNVRDGIVREWQENGFDAVIAPALGCTPVPVGWARHSLGSLTYTTAFNFLNFPAGSMPVTTVERKDFEVPYPIKDPFHWVGKKAMKGTEGLPVNVQVVSLPWQDEKCLYAMKVLEEALKK